MWLENCGQVLQGFLVSISSSGLQHIYVNIFWRIHFINCWGKTLGGLLLTDSDHCRFNHLQITSRWVSVTQRWRIFITFINSARILQTYDKCATRWHARQGRDEGHGQHITGRVDSAHGQAGIPLLVPASNTQVGHNLKRYQNSDYTCKFDTSQVSQLPNSHLVSFQMSFSTWSRLPSVSQLCQTCQSRAGVSDNPAHLKTARDAYIEAPRSLPLWWRRRHLLMEPPAFTNLIRCFFHFYLLVFILGFGKWSSEVSPDYQIIHCIKEMTTPIVNGSYRIF